MARIAYILLCHRNPAAIVAQARRLTAAGDRIAIHYDGRAPRSDFDRIRSELRDVAGVAFARRVKCGWGEWSLVAATLSGLRTAIEAFPDATHFYLLSGDCMAIKTAEWAHAYLGARSADFIECVDYFRGGWIKTGLREERLVYRHPFNERKNKRLFYASLALQKRLKLERRVPAGLEMMIGSQWWCLRRSTAEAVLGFLKSRPDIVRFFRTTWIPDETFFQTLVRHLVPEDEIEPRTLTFLMFTDYGMPVTFYNDHYDLLMGQEALFARKISPEARELKARLGELYQAKGLDFRISNEGRTVHAFLTSRGRVGQRFAPRFWEEGATLGRDRELMIVTCKKWHVARRLVDSLSFVSNVPAVEYVFDEEEVALPDLGGIQTTLAKRSRHRRALMRLVYEHLGTDRLVMCLDPANFELLQDFYSDRCTTKLLEIDCSMTDAYLEGHARRTGLAGDHTSPETIAALLPAVRNAVHREVDRIRDARFPGYHRISETEEPAANARPLASFFSIPEDKARELAATPYLFAD
jgi:hypothetical protein